MMAETNLEAAEMKDGSFCLPEAAVDVVRRMLDPENTESYTALEEAFQAALPKACQGWFVDVDFEEYPWSHSGLALNDYLVVFDGVGWVAAVVSQDEVLYMDDFLKLMGENGLDNSALLAVWLAFEDVAPKMEGVSLRERVEKAVDTVRGFAIDALIDGASKRSQECSKDLVPEGKDGVCK